MQCKFCHVFYPAENFITHVKTCTKDTHSGRLGFFKVPMSVQIRHFVMVEDESEHRTYTEYMIDVSFSDTLWQISQKYKAFCSLHESLVAQYPSVQFPESSYQFAAKSLRELDNSQ